MATLREYSYNELVEDYIFDLETLENGLMDANKRLVAKVATSHFIRGFFNGIGYFIGGVI